MTPFVFISGYHYFVGTYFLRFHIYLEDGGYMFLCSFGNHLRLHVVSTQKAATRKVICLNIGLLSSFGLSHLSVISFHFAIEPEVSRSRDSSVGIATDYGLDDRERREFESR
jgi:hypothetical protein